MAATNDETSCRGDSTTLAPSPTKSVRKQQEASETAATTNQRNQQVTSNSGTNEAAISVLIASEGDVHDAHSTTTTLANNNNNNNNTCNDINLNLSANQPLRPSNSLRQGEAERTTTTTSSKLRVVDADATPTSGDGAGDKKVVGGGGGSSSEPAQGSPLHLPPKPKPKLKPDTANDADADANEADSDANEADLKSSGGGGGDGGDDDDDRRKEKQPQNPKQPSPILQVPSVSSASQNFVTISLPSIEHEKQQLNIKPNNKLQEAPTLTTISTTTTKQQQQQQQQQQLTTTTTTPTTDPQNQNSLFLNRFEFISASGRKLVPQELRLQKQNLSYLQGLLIRKWPYLPLAILIMFTTLIVGLLIVLDSRLCRFQSSSSSAALELAEASARPSAIAASSIAASEMNSPLITSHKLQLMQQPKSFENPGELSAHVFNSDQSSSSPEQQQQQLTFRSNETLTSKANQSNNQQFQRLPTSVWPIHYDLFIQPHIYEPNFNFTGRVSILIECREAADNITLHSIDLEFNESTLSLEQVNNNNNNSRKAPKIKRLSQDKQLQYSIIELEDKLEIGREYALHIDYKGNLHEDLSGFYKIKYEQQNKTEPTWIAATQFQATDARRAFPCFDEPNYKATFSIQIKHWRNMTALSNMPIKESLNSKDGLWVTDSFEKSHRMSTYLVAFAVTNFESRSDGNISVWTRPGFAHTAEYSLKVAKKILKFYEDFFGIDYPLPKMDMIALPDFNAGAMENWGLITYRETTMLYDENSSSIVNKQRVAVVVAHELAHQWFGNLVTPKWWDDLWLNEGFASYVEYIGVDHIEPNWRMLDQFVVDEVHNVFKLDSLSSSHQISIPVTNPDEISEIFDHISYAKGASVIRMMSHFLTQEVFKAGLTRYLRALKYSNAEQSDLWAHLTEAQRLSLSANTKSNSSSSSNQLQAVNVEKVMNSWTLQTGYPLVTLTRQYNGAKTMTFDQIHYQPFKFQQQANNSISSNNSSTNGEINRSIMVNSMTGLSRQKWEVPITFTSKSELNWEPRTRVWLHQNDSGPTTFSPSKLSVLNSIDDNEWILVNIDQAGYFRVNYDLKNWKLLIDQLNTNHKLIKNTNRAQILDDLFELARGSVIDYKFAMEATKYLQKEQDYLPWDAVLASFGYIDDMLQRTSIYGDWKEYVQALIAPYYSRYKNIDWNLIRANDSSVSLQVTNQTTTTANNDLIEQYNHANAIYWACSVDEHCIQKAKTLFRQWKQGNRNQINPAFRHTVYCTAIQNGNKDDWDWLWKIYEKEQNASEKDRLMRALCCSRETWILARYLEWTFDRTKSIRRQDGAYVFRLIAKNIHGRDIAFNFMRERWSTIKEFYGKSSFSLGNLIRSVAYLMNTQVELNQLIQFYESIKSDVGNGKRSFQIAIEEVESNVAWKNRNFKILGDWLAEVRGKMNGSPSS